MKEQWIAGRVFCLFIMSVAFCAQGKEDPTRAAQRSAASQSSIRPISWGRCLSQKPEFYAGDEAIRIADNVLLYQRNTGGWPSNIDITRKLTEKEKEHVRTTKGKEDSTFDNGATHTHLRYLAKVYNATNIERFKQGFYNGVDYLLKAQYANGGWPQAYPRLQGYHRYITFNDGAMIGVMTLLDDITENKPPYLFVNEDRQKKAHQAVQKGIDCILKCQIIVDGRCTAWAQQHDEKNFEPRPARAFEPTAICGAESVGIVRFLMSIDNPNPQVIEAVQAAIAWFDLVKITGIRQIKKPDPSSEKGYDMVIIADANAPPLWARFYEIGTNRPIFGDRDGKVYYAMSEISPERRTNYTWYGNWPAELLDKDYPAWQKK